MGGGGGVEAEMGGRHTFFLLNASLISNEECQDFCTGGGGGGVIQY
jgi:hypothetical protein